MLIVEDGTARSDSESYVSAADCATYASNRALAFNGGDAGAEPALRRATAYIDATYQSRFSGFPLLYGTQSLQWPRIGAYIEIPEAGRDKAFLYAATDGYWYGGVYFFQTNVIPKQIITATCEAAIREFGTPGSLAPDLDRGNAIVRLQAGSVSVQYGANAPATTTFQVLDQALASLLMPANMFGGRAVRG